MYQKWDSQTVKSRKSTVIDGVQTENHQIKWNRGRCEVDWISQVRLKVRHSGVLESRTGLIRLYTNPHKDRTTCVSGAFSSHCFPLNVSLQESVLVWSYKSLQIRNFCVWQQTFPLIIPCAEGQCLLANLLVDTCEVADKTLFKQREKPLGVYSSARSHTCCSVECLWCFYKENKCKMSKSSMTAPENLHQSRLIWGEAQENDALWSAKSLLREISISLTICALSLKYIFFNEERTVRQRFSTIQEKICYCFQLRADFFLLQIVF